MYLIVYVVVVSRIKHVKHGDATSTRLDVRCHGAMWPRDPLQEGARFAKWRNVLQMDPAKGQTHGNTSHGEEHEAMNKKHTLWIDELMLVYFGGWNSIR